MGSEAIYFPPGGRDTDEGRDSLSEKLRNAGKEGACSWRIGVLCCAVPAQLSVPGCLMHRTTQGRAPCSCVKGSETAHCRWKRGGLCTGSRFATA